MSTINSVRRETPGARLLRVDICDFVGRRPTGHWRIGRNAEEPRRQATPGLSYALIAMLAGPSMTGILLTALVYGRAGLREFLVASAHMAGGRAAGTPSRSWRPQLVMTATLLALSLTSPAFLPGIVTSDDKASLLLVSLAVGLSAGVFEELGWTGFAIPTLRRRYGILATGLIVGVWWSAWHLFRTSGRAARHPANSPCPCSWRRPLSASSSDT